MKTRLLISLVLLAAITASLFALPHANSQSTAVTTTTTIAQPAAGQCTELTFSFSGQKNKEVFGTFGADASVDFYVLSLADYSAIQNPTCTPPSSSRPLYGVTSAVGFGNNYRSNPFPSDGTYYIVFVLRNTGNSQLASGYATIQLTYPVGTTLNGSGTTTTSVASSTSLTSTSNQTSTQVVVPTSSTVASTGPSFGVFGAVGVVVLIAIVAGALVFMKRGKKPAEPKAILRQETVTQKPQPPPAAITAAPKAEQEPKVTPSPSMVKLKPADSISTGYPELDTVLAGGLPVGYAILIVSPPCDERDLLFQKVIESSLSMGCPIFFLSRDLIRTQDFANKYQKNFHVFSPQADKLQSAGGKVFKIQGLQNLSDLNISFTKAVEELPNSLPGKLIIIDLLSDILLEHKALTTRKWLDGFIGKRKTEGFTMIGVLNPLISSPQDIQTITDLFDGIIEIYEKELKERSRRFLVVRKMYGRRYSDTEVMLDKDKLY